MKMRYLHRFLFAAAAAVALVSCNKEQDKSASELDSDSPKNYMGFTISMPSATKAETTGGTGTYVVGEDYENAINTIHFYFYRKGAYVSWGYGDVATQFKPNAGTGDVEEKLDNNSQAGKGVVVLESTMAIPDQVLCVINSRNYQWYRNKSLETVLDAIHSGTAESLTGNVTDSYKDFAYLDKGEPYFVMFTSPMYGTKAGTTDTKEVKYVSDILVEETTPGSGIFTANSYIKNNRQDAMDKPLEIYVERMAARFDVDNCEPGTPGGVLDAAGKYVDKSKLDASLLDGSGNPLWDIEPLAWSVTAPNKKAYSLKHINNGWFSQTGANQPFYGGWLQSGGSFVNPVKTSESMFTRINWTMDPNYTNPTVTDKYNYPHSARGILDQNQLKYWSAAEVAANYGGAEKSQFDLLQRYSYENTYGLEGQLSPRINGTMLLLYAQVKKAGAAAYEDLFAYMGQMETSQEYIAQLLSTMDAHGYTFYIENGGKYKPIHKPASLGGALEDFTKDFMDPTKAYLKVVKATKILDFYSNTQKSGAYTNDTPATALDAYPDMVVDLSGSLQPNLFEGKFAAVPDDFLSNDAMGYADGYVTLVPNDYKTKCPTLYVENPSYDPAVTDPSDPRSKQYLEASKEQIAKGFLNGVVEPANMYRKGKMYYAIPIEHYGKATDTSAEKNPLEGNYGVVRNNFYKVSIGTFKSLGHGIDDVDEPIVPGDRQKPYYLAAKINILSWQVATQTHDLEE
jgi:hypothetical protein